MSDSSKYFMKMDMNVLNHLGLNLYSNTSAVISEVVANSWDADATNVAITLSEDCIVIHDDGSGMNLTDINEKYLCVGHQKRIEKAVTSKYHRSVMGRKGIGKLSLFSIANDITILTQKDGEKNAFRMTSQSLTNAINTNGTYNPEELPIEMIEFEGNGTTIILKDLKKSRTTALSTHLKKRIARRFSVISTNDNFNVSVNGEPITIEDRAYLSKAQLLWYYPRPASEGKSEWNSHYFINQCKSDVMAKSFERSGTIEIDGNNVAIYGWIATAADTSVLKDDENINRIVVMVRGKMAKENILPEKNATALYSKYVFGEIHAEFLDDDDRDDITTSSRQDFFDEDIRYIKLVEFIKSELGFVRSKWEEHRSNLGAEEACKYEVIRTWYDGLDGDNQRAAKKLFGKINQLTVPNDEKKTLFKHSILAFESLKLKSELSVLESIDAENVDAFLQVAARLENIEATYYYQIVRERLAVIQKLKSVIKDNDLEKVVQYHLADNMWLLDPSWDRGTEIPVIEETVQKQFDAINSTLTQEEKDARFDIRYRKTAKKHVIVELKRGQRVVKSGELTTQIMKYHSAMVKILQDTNRSDEPFEIIVLIGKRLDGQNFNQAVYNDLVKMFSTIHTRIMMYDELLANAEALYTDYLEKHREADKLNDILKELSDD